MSEVTVQPDAPTPAAVEWDHRGRVVSCRFKNGYVSQFRYDAGGSLYAFTYGRLAWSTTDGAVWTAQDSGAHYVLGARVSVCQDGTLKIERSDLVRTLALDGRISDRYANGSVLESQRATGDVTPMDLLATCTPKLQAAAGTYNLCESLPAQAATDNEDPADTRRGIAGGIRLKRVQVRDVVERPQVTTWETLSTAWSVVFSEYAVRVIETVRGKDCIGMAPFLDALANIAYKQRRIDESRVLHERALQLRASQLGGNHADVSINLHGLGRIYHEWGRYAEAEQYLLQTIRICEKGLQKSRFLHDTGAVSEAHVTEHVRRLISALHSLASLYHEQRKRQLCEKICEGAVAAAAALTPSQREAVAPLIESMAGMSAQLGLEYTPKSVYRTAKLRTSS